MNKRRVRHRCDICDSGAAYYAHAIVVMGRVPDGGLIVAQCARCKRFVCSDHAEYAVCWLGKAATEPLKKMIEESGFLPTVLCCPFHRKPLGQFADYMVLVATEHKASELSQEYARAYVRNPERYVRGLHGFDLSDRKAESAGAAPWPAEDIQASRLLDHLKAGQAAFEERMQAESSREFTGNSTRE